MIKQLREAVYRYADADQQRAKGTAYSAVTDILAGPVQPRLARLTRPEARVAPLIGDGQDAIAATDSGAFATCDQPATCSCKAPQAPGRPLHIVRGHR